MSAQHSVCRVCCDTFDENDVKVIDEGLGGILQTVLLRIDLTISPNPVICNKCHEKLKSNYIFKKKCVFTEDSITPFVAENVNLNLKEIRSQIIKFESMEDEKNVCRLCLQFVDNDMTLSDSEKEQFQRVFPEINLYRTNFVILCSPCYDLLHKYFIFVTSCLELEQELCNYALDRTDSKVNIIEHIGIKLEDFQKFTKNIKEEPILNEEFDIKCETEEEDKQSDNFSQEVEHLQIIKKEQFYSNEDINKFVDFPHEHNSNDAIFKKHCNKECKSKDGLKSHVLKIHSHGSTITCHKCEHCGRKFKLKHILKTHILNVHTDPSKIPWHQCKHCKKKFKHSYDLKRHILDVHIDLSEIKCFQCEECNKKFKYNKRLKDHMLTEHIHPSKIVWYQCEQCDKKFKWNYRLKRHILIVHADPSKIVKFKCEECNREFKEKSKLKKHILYMHTDSSKITWFQCGQCNKNFKQKSNLKMHIRNMHNGSSNMARYDSNNQEQLPLKKKAESDSDIFSDENLSDQAKSVIKNEAPKCEQCDKQFKNKLVLRRHMLFIHTDPSKMILYQCECCDRKFKHKKSLKDHTLTIHADPSKITWYQCEKCHKKFKLKNNLKMHIRYVHNGACSLGSF